MSLTPTQKKVLRQLAWRQINFRFWRQKLVIWIVSLGMLSSVYMICYLLGDLGDRRPFEVQESPCDSNPAKNVGVSKADGIQ